MTPSPFGRHQRCGFRLARALITAIEANDCKAEVLLDIDWIISEDTVVRPDVVVLCGGVPERHVTEPPALVAEVLSPGTSDRDRNEKLWLYEESGVMYYLIVDPDSSTLIAYQRDATGKFGKWNAESLQFAICDDCEIVLDRKAAF